MMVQESRFCETAEPRGSQNKDIETWPSPPGRAPPIRAPPPPSLLLWPRRFPTRRPHPSSPVEDDATFALRSLQQAHANNKRYDASDAELLKFYEQMVLIRRFEEKAGQLYGLGLIGGFCHLYIGQEAVAVGSSRRSTRARQRHHRLSRPWPHAGLWHRSQGDHGRTDRSRCGYLARQGRVDAHVLDRAQVLWRPRHRRRAGLAGRGPGLRAQVPQDGGVCMAYFGDGAANQGQVYETFNMAALWKLPIVFVVENNGYAMGTAVKRGSAETHFYRRGTAFRIPGMPVNGMDVLEVRQAAEVALEYVRAGNGPVLMELNTYRYRGHSMSDPAKYRSREEVQEMRDKHDPIEAPSRNCSSAA
jgi:pyruvate dehydrogenase E1 component alpha subunit